MSERFSKGRLKQQAFNWAKEDLTRLNINAPIVDLEGEFPAECQGVMFSLFRDAITGEAFLRADYASGYTAYWHIHNYDAIRFSLHRFVQAAEENGVAIYQKMRYAANI